jgi:acyl carrier protein
VNNQEVLQCLTEIFREVFDSDAIVVTNDTTAADIEGWDSFNHINLIIAVENRLNIRFQVAEVEELRNVGELARVIEKKMR